MTKNYYYYYYYYYDYYYYYIIIIIIIKLTTKSGLFTIKFCLKKKNYPVQVLFTIHFD